MADLYCRDSHQIKGTEVSRTTHVEGIVVRERRCKDCERKFVTIEQNRDSAEEAVRGRMEELRRAKEERDSIIRSALKYGEALSDVETARGKLIEEATEMEK